MLVEPLHPTELSWIVRLQSFGEYGSVMKAASNLGPSAYLIGLLALTYLCWDSRLGARLLLAYFTCDYVSYLGKLIFHSPRPWWVDPLVKGYEPNTTSYGFPSGHALVATGVWFLCAHTLKRPWAWAAAGAIVFSVCFSRVYLGSHFISDVVGGFLIGSAWLWIFLRQEQQVLESFQRRSLTQGIGICAAATAVLLGVGCVVRYLVAQADDPTRWVNYPGGAVGYKSLGIYTGALLGLGVGLNLAHRHAPFDAGGPWLHRLGRIGIVAVPGLIYWLRPRGLLKELPDFASLALHFGLFMLATTCLTFALPWLFLKLGLAEHRSRTGVPPVGA